MGKILLSSIIFVTVLTALARPWIGIIAYYLLALLGPQYIWWWNFEGLRVSFFVAVFTLTGIVIKILQKEYDFSLLKTKHNLWLLLLWLFVSLSYFMGPFVSSYNSAGLSPVQVFSLTNNIFIFYFCATLVMNDEKKLRYLSMVIVVSTAYLIYWANTQYFTSNWSQFDMGRLMGPSSIDGGSIYVDENAFAMLFVTGIPFIYYTGFGVARKWLRYALWAIIPFGWHAVFLTGSRGGLLGLAITVLLPVLQSQRKYLAMLIIPLFMFFYQWQAGSTMKDRSETIKEYEGESSAEARITAWKGGLKMIEAHPAIGVGLGSFITALPNFIESKPRVAHNTLIQFTAESGIGAGLCYLLIVYTFFASSRRISAWCKEQGENPDVHRIMCLNNAGTVSFAGLIVCSLFLSLNTYEVFFYLLIFNNSLLVLCSPSKEQVSVPAVVLRAPC